MINRKGQMFLFNPFIIASIIIGFLVVLILGIIFSKQINASILAVVGFMSKYGVFIFASTLIYIFKEPIIDVLYFVGGLVKRFF